MEKGQRENCSKPGSYAPWQADPTVSPTPPDSLQKGRRATVAFLGGTFSPIPSHPLPVHSRAQAGLWPVSLPWASGLSWARKPGPLPALPLVPIPPRCPSQRGDTSCPNHRSPEQMRADTVLKWRKTTSSHHPSLGGVFAGSHGCEPERACGHKLGAWQWLTQAWDGESRLPGDEETPASEAEGGRGS